MINFIDNTRLYTGITTQLRFVNVPITITPNDTLIAFVMCMNQTGLTPIYSDEWKLVNQIEGTSVGGYGTLLCLSLQQTGTTTNPTYEISGLGESLHCGVISRFRNCIKNLNNSVNFQVGRYNTGPIVGTGGIKPKNKNSMIITAVGTTLTNIISNWNSDGSLLITERFQYGSQNVGLGQTIRLAVSTSLPAAEITYNIGYDITNNDDNIAMSVSLTPSINTNKVMNIIEALHYYQQP